MKKILSSLVIAMLISGQALANPLLAQTQTLFSETSAQSNFNGSVKINNQDSSNFNTFYDSLKEAISLTDDYNPKEDAIAKLLLSTFDDTNLEIISQNGNAVLTADISEEAFADLATDIENYTSLREIQEGENTIYRFPFKDLSFANINQKFVLAKKADHISALQSQISNSSIEMSSDLLIDVDGEFSGAMFDFSLTQDGNALAYNSETTFESEENLSELNSSSHLYDVLPAQSPMLYFEFNNLLETLQLSSSTLNPELETEVNSSIESEVSADLPSYETLLNKQMAILVDKTDTRVPNVTLAIEEPSTTETQELNNWLNDLADEAVNSSSQDMTIERTSVNDQLNKLTINFSQTSEFSDFGMDTLEITYGEINDTFVITNNTSINTEIQANSEKVSNVTKFQNSFANQEASTLSNFYLDFAEVGSYLNMLEEDSESFTPSEILESDLEILNKMGVWSGFAAATDNSIREEGTMNIPFQDLSTLLEASLQNRANVTSPFSYNPFTDVPEDAWFYEEVSQAYESYIIDTYDYETETFSYQFNPGKEITRGEFVQMIINAYEIDEEPTQSGSEIFSDVEAGAYFDFAIGVAFQEGIIQGDDNANTFRPNDTLNRAEAVQILYNASPLLNGKNAQEEKFVDVAANAWYANVVAVATMEGIVEGINQQEFAPGKKLNKAEAVTLLIRLVNNEVRF